MGAQGNWVLGHPDKALASGREALALAELVAHPLSIEFVLLFNAMLHVDRGEPGLALRRVEAAETLVAEQRLGFVMEPRFLRGAALCVQGAFDESVSCLRNALAGRQGAMTFRPYGFTRLAEALASQGQYSAVIAAVKEGMEAQEKTGALRWGAELLRLQGIALIGLNRVEDGQSALEEALRVARQQQAKAYELRAATSLARLWGERGRRAEARGLLAPVYGWFTEGFDTADLERGEGSPRRARLKRLRCTARLRLPTRETARTNSTSKSNITHRSTCGPQLGQTARSIAARPRWSAPTSVRTIGWVWLT